jgi:hypothetical protein
VNTINTLMQSPFWDTTAIIIAYDDSDGWYDHVMGPIVSQSATPDDQLNGPGVCGPGTSAVYQGRCGFGPRLPLLVISPYAKVNYVDHGVTDQSSILRFIEDNWSLGRIGDNSTDAVARTLNAMFNFQLQTARTLLLDPSSGAVVAGGPTGAGITRAVVNPKDFTTKSLQILLDGSTSTSFDGGPLTYQWSVNANSLPAVMSGSNNASIANIELVGGPGTYTFTLVVTDSASNTAKDTVRVVKQ